GVYGDFGRSPAEPPATGALRSGVQLPASSDGGATSRGGTSTPGGGIDESGASTHEAVGDNPGKSFGKTLQSHVRSELTKTQFFSIINNSITTDGKFLPFGEIPTKGWQIIVVGIVACFLGALGGALSVSFKLAGHSDEGDADGGDGDAHAPQRKPNPDSSDSITFQGRLDDFLPYFRSEEHTSEL